jgi:hypothetical protein
MSICTINMPCFLLLIFYVYIFLLWIYKIINVIYLESNILFLRMLALVVFGNYFKVEKTKTDEINKTV